MQSIISRTLLLLFTSTTLLVAGCSGFISSSSLDASIAQIDYPPVIGMDQIEESAFLQLSTNLTDDFIDPTNVEFIAPTDIDMDIAPLNAAKQVAPASIELTNNEAEEQQWLSYNIKRGDTLGRILASFGVGASQTAELVKSSKIAASLTRLRPDHILRLQIAEDTKQLQKLEYERNKLETVKASYTDSGFVSTVLAADVTHTQAYAHGVIHNSLFADGKAAGLSDRVIMHLADIFAWDVDFALHIHDGDSFSVLYDKLSVDGEPLQDGEILAAEFINHGVVHTAVRYQDKNGNTSYYAKDGTALRKAFLRTPVKFSRISSRFNLRRKHPILNRIRAHKGVDYAAPTGTPVRATGNGTIIHRGRKGGYGNVVILQHGQTTSTLYAHLSKFRRGQRVGKKVQQGDIIGYVGKTGLASGPHLHYEFRIAGVHKNPLTVKLSKSVSIAKNEMADFKSQSQPLLQTLAENTRTLLASSEQH